MTWRTLEGPLVGLVIIDEPGARSKAYATTMANNVVGWVRALQWTRVNVVCVHADVGAVNTMASELVTAMKGAVHEPTEDDILEEEIAPPTKGKKKRGQ